MEREISDLGPEIRHTTTSTYRDDLKAQKKIMRTLRDEVKNRPGSIRIMEFAPAVELILEDKGRAAGAVLVNLKTEQVLVARSKAVIIATGGCGRLHIQGFPTTNHYGATADGVIMACRAGAGSRGS